MAVRVLVERNVKAGYESWVWRMLREIRAEVLKAHGYLYGETWRSVDNRRKLMNLSVWGSLDNWQRFEQSAARQRIDKRIGAMLRGRKVVRVFEDAIDPRWDPEFPIPGRRSRAGKADESVDASSNGPSART
jgi:heme-degrading monooxygenase HmoA